MSNKTVISTYFQLHYPWLEKPQDPRKESDVPKYGFRMAFPQDEQLPEHIGTESCSVSNILEALDEVCMAEWDCSFEEAPEMRGIAFPPEFKDGNLDLKKDDKGNRLRGEPNEQSAGKWLLGAKNAGRIGVADHTGGLELDPKEAYAGCWCRAELEIAAYDIGEGKDRASILVIKALNLQKCFDDERIGNGGTPQQSATQAFAGKTVVNSNCKPTGFSGKSAPSRPGADKPVYTMTAEAGEYTREDYLSDPDWTDELLVSEGLMVIEGEAAGASDYMKPKPRRPGMPK